MADAADPNKKYEDQRAALRDTAKWIVTILGATIVLVIGGGLIAKIADLDSTPRLYAAGCLAALMLLCLVPLKWAVDIVSASLAPLQELAKDGKYRTSREAVNALLALYDPRLNSVEALYAEYERQTQLANHGAAEEKARADRALDELQPRLREANELTNTEYVRRKFTQLIRTTMVVLPLIAVSLFGFLYYSHADTATEKPLAKPMLMQPPAGVDLAAVLKQAGVADSSCAAGARLVQLSELSGLRAGVLIVPQALGPNCPAVRAIVANTGQIVAGN